MPAVEDPIDRWERVLTGLAMTAYRQWCGRARELALPSLTASAPAFDALPPNPAAIGDAGWLEILEATVIEGIGVMEAARLAEVYEDRGIVPTPDADALVPLPSGPVAVAAVLDRHPDLLADLLAGQTVEAITIVAGTSAYRDVTADYLAGVTNRCKDMPTDVFHAITRDLADGMSKGEGAADLGRRVRTFLNPDSEGGIQTWMHRAQRIARTEATGAYNHATLTAAREEVRLLGTDLQKVWIATIDGRTRKSHFAADGQRVELDGEFRIGRARLRYPGDPHGPASETVHCRCTVATIERGDSLPGERDRQTERTGKNPPAEVTRREADGVTRARDDPDGVGIIAAANPEGAPMTRRTWTGLLAPIGKPTGDGRIFAADINLEFREFPMPLMWQKATDVGHDKSVIVGRIDSAQIKDGALIGDGTWFDSPEAEEAAVLLEEGVIRPSVDLCDVDWAIVDADGNEIPEDVLMDAFEHGEQIAALECTTAATLMGATMVAKPAFAEAKIEFTGSTDEDVDDDTLVAAGAPWAGTSAYFADPQLDQLTPLTVDADGRVYGHLAGWNVCHFGIGTSGRCQMAPHSMTGYAYFHVSEIDTDQGRLPVGRLTIGGGHAGPSAGVRAALAHYDDVGSSWAYVRAYEDEFGIAVAGQVHPSATAEQVREGSGTPLSGDWRKVGSNLELVAALGVVSGGFPIPRGSQDDAGREVSLVAAGAIPLTTRRSVSRRVLDDLADAAADRAVAKYADAERRRVHGQRLSAQVRKRAAHRIAAQIKGRR